LGLQAKLRGVKEEDFCSLKELYPFVGGMWGCPYLSLLLVSFGNNGDTK